MEIKKVLIANRGEIAIRVIKACHDMGIKAVAIYSSADKHALHVLEADEAYCIGAPPAGKSYLNVTGILTIARAAHADSLSFLETWIRYSGNVPKITEELYLHRNTVHYRINKVKEILGYDDMVTNSSRLF